MIMWVNEDLLILPPRCPCVCLSLGGPRSWCVCGICKARRQYLLTCKVSRYCLLALHDTQWTLRGADTWLAFNITRDFLVLFVSSAVSTSPPPPHPTPPVKKDTHTTCQYLIARSGGLSKPGSNVGWTAGQRLRRWPAVQPTFGLSPPPPLLHPGTHWRTPLPKIHNQSNQSMAGYFCRFFNGVCPGLGLAGFQGCPPDTPDSIMATWVRRPVCGSDNKQTN